MKSVHIAHLCRAILVIILTLQTCNSVDLTEELRVTHEQKADMDKLKQRMLPHITESWMKEDLNIVRFLRVADFNLEGAQRRMLDTIKWRKDFKMATIHLEDFSELVDEYPYVFTDDKQGQPVFIGFAGEWDIRNAVITGRAQRVLRYVYQALENSARKVRELQYQGHNVTRFNLIIDVDGFNLVQHACVQCIVRILDVVLTYDQFYPGFLDRLLILNTPPSIAAVIEAVRNVANPVSFSRLKLYGIDRSVWQRALLEFIDKKNIPVELGGTLSRN